MSNKHLKLTRNYGLKLEPVLPDEWVLGAVGDVRGEDILPSGDWRPFIPNVAEYQQFPGFEPYNCTIFGSSNAIETLIKFHYGLVVNWSDRFGGKIAEVGIGGTSPHKACEAIRTKGLPYEEEWPWNPSLDTFDEYYSEIPKEIFKKAEEQFLEQWDFKHAWLGGDNASLKAGLKKGAVCLSVPAWFEGKDGIYYRPEGIEDNHWVQLVHMEEGKYKLVLDSYPDDGQPLKKIAWDMHHYAAKLYTVKKGVAEEYSLKKKLIDLIGKVLALLGIELNKEITKMSLPTPTPEEPVKPVDAPKPPRRLQVLEVAKSCLGRDISAKEDELGCAESVSTILNKVDPNFPDSILHTYALYDTLKRHKEFKVTLDLVPGNVIVSPTGLGIGHGHCGIIGENGKIMSNTSKNSKWEENYTIASWVKKFRTQGKFPIYVFELL